MTRMVHLGRSDLMSDGGRRWLLVGVAEILAGVVVLLVPGVTVLALALLFGALLIAVGLVALAFAAVARRGGGSGLVATVVAVLAFVAGIVCFVHPGTGARAVAVIVALWFLLTGVADLVASRAYPRQSTYFLVLGVLGLVAGLILLIDPGLAVATLAVLAGVFFLVRGAGQLSLGLYVRRAGHVRR